MPKVPKFEVKKTARGWKLNIPASISDTGKKLELYFTSRDKAAEEAQKRRGEYRANGEQATVLPPRVADDALKAWAILEPLGLTLTQAAREAKVRHDALERSVPIEDAITAWKASNTAKNLRPDTTKSYKHTAAKLLTAFPKRKIADIKPAELEPVLSGKSYALHRRNARALWKWAAKSPRKWADDRFFADVDSFTVHSDHDISTLPPDEVQLILRTAEKHFPDTVPIYVVRFFGGVRSQEAERMTGEEINEEGIEIGLAIAKKRKRRHIPMSPTLEAWLKAYPFKPCANWVEKDKAVRRLAGYNVAARILKDPPKPIPGRKWPKNVIRHTHASVEIANGATLEDLLFRFGHTEKPEVLRSHYVGRMTKKDAVAILSIGPNETTVDLIKAA